MEAKVNARVKETVEVSAWVIPQFLLRGKLGVAVDRLVDRSVQILRSVDEV